MEASAVESAESWLYWIGIAKLAAAFLVAAGVAVEFGSDWVARPFEKAVKDARDTELSRMATDLGTANAAIAKSDAETAKANAAAAQANERAAEVMKATAWRQFTPDQISKLTEALSNQSGKYVAAWIANDPESFGLAYQFVELLHAFPGKWDMQNSAKVYPTNLVWGVVIPDVPGAEPTVTVFRDAFTQAGIHFSTGPLPTESMSYGPSDASLLAGRAIVLFGSRLPTFTQAPN